MNDDPDPHPRYHVRVSQRELPRTARWPVRFLRQVARTAAAEGGCEGRAELGLTLTDDERVRALNRDYRGLDRPTDVLSFALEEGEELVLPPGIPRQLGDVVVSVDTIRRQADELKVSLESELAWVISHGVLHLLGYDHQTSAQEERMRARERAILDRLGLAHQGRL